MAHTSTVNAPVTTRSPEVAAQILLPVLRSRATHDQGVSVTTADAATSTGLALREAESGLHVLVARFRGHLAVAEDGTLIFKFADGLRTDWQRRGRVYAFFRGIERALDAIYKFVARSAITILLVGYAIVYLVLLTIGAIALSFAAEDGGPLEASFYLWWLMIELIGDALFWASHPASTYATERQRKRGPGKRPRRHLYDKINRFFIGVSPGYERPRELHTMVLSLIRQNHGVITLGQVIAVTGEPRWEAEARLSRLLLDYDGDVDVSPEGAILYHFPALLHTASDQLEYGPVNPIWRRPVQVIPFSGNRFSTNLAIVMLTAFNGGMAWACMAFGLPFYLAEVPLALVLFLFALPILRIVPVIVSRYRARRENGRRAMLGAVFEAAEEDRCVSHAAMASAWRERVGRAPGEERVYDMVLDLGGELDANIEAFTAPESPAEDAGATGYRFDTLACEARALERARERGLAQTLAQAEDPSAIVYTSDEPAS